MPNAMIESLQGQDSSLIENSALLFSKLKENVEISKGELTALMQGVGIETSDSFINTLSEKEPEVQMKAIELLGQFKYGTDTEKINILNTLYDMGLQVPDSLSQGLKDNYGVLQESTSGAVYLIDRVTGQKVQEITPKFREYLNSLGIQGFNSMEEAMQKEDLKAPGIESPDCKAYTAGVQNQMNNNGVYIPAYLSLASTKVRVKGTNNYIMPFATGGIVESPEIALIGEAGPESIIPLSSSKRTRALELYTQTSEALGVDEQITRAAVMSSVSGSRAAMAFLAAGPVPSENRVEINYKKLAQELYGALSASPIQVKPSFTVTGGDIYLDTTKAGKALAPHIDAELGRINHRRERGI